MRGMSLTAQAIKISHALELLETQTLSGLNQYLRGLIQQAEQKQSKAVQNLTKSPEFNAALISLSSLLTTQFRETALSIVNSLNLLSNLRASLFVGQTKKANTGLSQKEQKQIIEKFREGKINILCATSIGEEGLDIPEVSSVIFYEPIPSAIRKIQRAGRTARLSPGKLIILVTQDTRDVAHHYASSARERKMHKSLEQIQKELKNKLPTLNDFK
jgi:Fanconi anemia group M protein